MALGFVNSSIFVPQTGSQFWIILHQLLKKATKI